MADVEAARDGNPHPVRCSLLTWGKVTQKTVNSSASESRVLLNLVSPERKIPPVPPLFSKIFRQKRKKYSSQFVKKMESYDKNLTIYDWAHNIENTKT
jgi:hypothetical protein